MSRSDNGKPLIAIVGGGPAGSVAALCLGRLGHRAVLFERERFPRYRIGESLLPGTLSILSRLGVLDRVEAAGFPKKRAATFLWGRDKPWSFTFSTPKTAPWIFDHAYQVTRAEYDQILLDAARDGGAEVRQDYQVTDIEAGSGDEPAVLSWKNGAESGTLDADYVIDASGAGSILARKHGLREWDAYYKNMAIWSYFRGGKRYEGDLAGNIFSVSFRDGWIWIIPQKDDMYSIGVVTGMEFNGRMKEIGPDEFYTRCLEACDFARDTLAGAEQVDKVRVVRDWAYAASQMALGRAFLCGDSACFIDPLFSQGVHLATYSAMLASSGIDYLLDHPEATEDVQTWYSRAYRTAYDRYHRFLTAFYFHCNEKDSAFWDARRVEGLADDRFEGREWFAALAGRNADGLEELESSATVLKTLWDHGDDELGEDFDETRLSLRRVRWAAELLRTFRRMKRVRWSGERVVLEPSFDVHPTTFKLQEIAHLANGAGRRCTSFPLAEPHRELFERTITEPTSYDELIRELRGLEQPVPPERVVRQLLEDGLLEGFDQEGTPIQVDFAMRFGGVGGDDDLI